MRWYHIRSGAGDGIRSGDRDRLRKLSHRLILKSFQSIFECLSCLLLLAFAFLDRLYTFSGGDGNSRLGSGRHGPSKQLPDGRWRSGCSLWLLG